MKKQKLLLVILIFIISALFISYYIFKMDSNNEGNTADVGNFNVIFKKIGTIEEVNSEGAKAVISEDKKYIYINVPRLLVKGAYAEFPIVIKNTGDLSAKLVSITEYGLDESGPIDVNYKGIGVTDEPLSPGEEKSFTVRVEWSRDMIESSASTNISIKFNYVQE